MTALYTHEKGSRCGWCIGGDHVNCIRAIEMGRAQGDSDQVDYRVMGRQGANDGIRFSWGVYTWRCECQEGPHPVSRCTKCLRAGVDVDHASRCVDRADCETTAAVALPHPPPIDAVERHAVKLGTSARPHTGNPWGDAHFEEDDEEDEDYELAV